MKKALITGITGQDGSYLTELLLEKGYEVHGIIRRSSSFNTSRLSHLYQDPHEKNRKLILHYGDLADAENIRKIIFSVKPDEIYNMGAQSHVRVSFDIPEYTANITALGTLRILETIRDLEKESGKKIKFYQASSSEMFGAALPPQHEKTPFHPRSPYGSAKVFAFHITKLYREAYGIFAVNGILFNHESPRRGETFVTRKITRGITRIKAGLDKKIYLGNLEARRDWGYAPEYMEATYLMMQHKNPDDFVIGTGKSHSIREFLEIAFKEAGLGDYKKYIGIDKRYYRPTEVNHLVADISKAKKVLGWKPKTSLKELIKIMLEAEKADLKYEFKK
ncbi:MAG: GDP-mannose 4,6-dehydratase [Candidatus Zambryskibacteria bacterium RIFCSPHIGHO2_12_FULL_38_34]|uniref:GDP-mannose 4,6-dehydratase n=1 Tax=Candidatus Zambryskibacteria bacterium RIFCSPLOWO2_12_FULL_39_16 TaxID=1802775 RepID=A0A1G2UQW1_9BACT|nr:MAG: GDP-mannose 4,6-dehydratase [Candidatus Zambryskibacteria bacterium RIFCSPHIGHO2_02_FULL_38_22]OHA97320.1 MAG: GDP-mannose 4,6-dehydratase [Candidatus Zambryskibacteria bacterium RIFCSPHIGHO2_12_FULL_38_34]OHB08236.1 MAG: GDP-mannose 4,6-dehydratase [Candidatus Zambryskibacteria bacterium RIFCSPLOWO2_02_FULL_38_13]OHB11778.1 MAG: GDP-mannose 4,6-dehydratase [Candidatus Zambryskibacteria bacterium RIFCSPLOWO2_12_FULL_39_16]